VLSSGRGAGCGAAPAVSRPADHCGEGNFTPKLVRDGAPEEEVGLVPFRAFNDITHRRGELERGDDHVASYTLDKGENVPVARDGVPRCVMDLPYDVKKSGGEGAAGIDGLAVGTGGQLAVVEVHGFCGVSEPVHVGRVRFGNAAVTVSGLNAIRVDPSEQLDATVELRQVAPAGSL
jgi:hypothetical protein